MLREKYLDYVPKITSISLLFLTTLDALDSEADCNNGTK